MARRRINFELLPHDSRARAIILLKRCKGNEAHSNLVPVRVDKNTIKLMSPEKAEKYLKNVNEGKDERES